MEEDPPKVTAVYEEGIQFSVSVGDGFADVTVQLDGKFKNRTGGLMGNT